MMKSKTKRQNLILFIFGVADFFNACCISLQGPFFPFEAEKKGATASEYGAVFGIYELVVFLLSPVYGRYIEKFGPKRLFHGGIITSGFCSILFGFLDRVEGHAMFISLAFAIRIVEAAGCAAFLTATFAIIANEFPNSVSTTFATLETCFGVGLIVGPTIGGILYGLGGYTTPFAALGAALFLTAILTAFVMPEYEESVNKSSTGKLLEVLEVKGIPICALTIMSTSLCLSFVQATLEPHIRKFYLSPTIIGIVFVISGVAYAVSATPWGWLIDKILHPKLAEVIGAILVIAGVSLIGPVPFFPWPTTIWLVIFGLLLFGLGVGARLVAVFTDALETVLASGRQNNLETYGMVSGLWTSTFALGAFIGPTISGLLYDKYGFASSSLFLVAIILILGIFEFLYYLKADIRHKISVNLNLMESPNNGGLRAALADTGIGENTPLIGENTPSISEKTPLIGENAPSISEKTPSISENTPSISEKTPLIGGNTPMIISE